MTTVAEVRTALHEEQELRLKLDALVCEAHACLIAGVEHFRNGREAEASILMDAAVRILGTHTG